MARNKRIMGITGYEVTYAVMNKESGQLEQFTVNVQSDSKRSLRKQIAEHHGVTPDEFIIMESKQFTEQYEIPDVIAALQKLNELGLAHLIPSE